jgi:uncharacterized membrane protein YfcA
MIDLQTFLAFCSGGVVGVMLGATGAGGSMLAIPLLVYLVGVPVQEATVISLMVVGYSALFGAWRKSRDQHVKGRAAIVFSSTGLVGAWVGAFGHSFFNEHTILLLFGLLMVGVSAWSLARKHRAMPDQVEGCARQLAWGSLQGFLGLGEGSSSFLH